MFACDLLSKQNSLQASQLLAHSLTTTLLVKLAEFTASFSWAQHAFDLVYRCYCLTFHCSSAEVMKAHIPGTSEHKLHKEEKNLQKDGKDMQKDMQKHEQELRKHENNVHKNAAKQEAKDYKNLNKQEEKLHKQEAKAAEAANKVAGHQTGLA